MSAVGSSCWGSSEGQMLVHVLQKLALPTRWVNQHWLLVGPSSSTTWAPGRVSQCDSHLWSIHVGGRGVGLWWVLPWAQASPTDWYRTIVAACGGQTPSSSLCWNEKASLWSWPAKLGRQSFSNIGFLAKQSQIIENNALLNDDITKMRFTLGGSVNKIEYSLLLKEHCSYDSR